MLPRHRNLKSDDAELLSSSAFEEGQLCHGLSWAVSDSRKLAGIVAQLLLGQHQHVARILQGVDGVPVAVTDSMIQATIRKLQPKTDKHKEHRDGWLFQTISWVAAWLSATKRIAMSAPHSRPADKGFDGLIVELDKAQRDSEGLTICEDKATANPRSLFKSQVLPEFAACDNGTRDSELVSELSTILCAAGLDHVEEYIERVLWQNRRSYRASLTVNSNQGSSTARRRLFKDYDETIDGPVRRRRAETFCLHPLREWMDEFSEMLIEQLEQLRSDFDV